jgi:hypothetical protein
MTSRKIKGIYQRGNIFWLTHGSGKHRLQESLKTSDYADAVAKAKEILNQPLLNTTTGFKPDLDDYAENQTKNGVWTRNSRKSKYSVLLMFGEDLNWTPLPALTIPKIQHWYDDQCKRIAVVSANPYVTIIKSFLNWAVEKNIIPKNPADGVKLQTWGRRDLRVPSQPGQGVRPRTARRLSRLLAARRLWRVWLAGAGKCRFDFGRLLGARTPEVRRGAG